ncbi:MAG: pyridoxamine 5'-phosphate oxidase family protein [Okeania sp. SIO3I5]|uniref:pyridoxamine 5'-phosphate oxidase family protein n=1 Tax=Okeania sp. SIO3I5 TaxID=2607805 RepID=UPI0013B7BF5A|nr:pyridoxamine 5'-phosphate oxidase family protein [Okeania sp. SIO3I5]NEQ39329.1 pyridoxamine 5'-phosphate oxidase family protein [Okeania sp. SIO3I5]
MQISSSIDELTEKAKQVLNKITYLTLATVDQEGNPWNSPVYSRFDEDYTFYWSSWIENQHSQNIINNGQVFAVVYDSTVLSGEGFGVYFQGIAEVIEAENEIFNKAIDTIYTKNGKPKRDKKYFLDLGLRRLFRFIPTTIWVNVKEPYEDYFLDKRVEITKEIKQ